MLLQLIAPYSTLWGSGATRLSVVGSFSNMARATVFAFPDVALHTGGSGGVVPSEHFRCQTNTRVEWTRRTQTRCIHTTRSVLRVHTAACGVRERAPVFSKNCCAAGHESV